METWREKENSANCKLTSRMILSSLLAGAAATLDFYHYSHCLPFDYVLYGTISIIKRDTSFVYSSTNNAPVVIVTNKNRQTGKTRYHIIGPSLRYPGAGGWS